MLRRLLSLIRRAHIEKDLNDEVQFHLAMQTKVNREAGMLPHEAELVAQRQFGGVAQQQEACRDHSFGSVESWARDLHYGVRSLRRSPGFTITVLLTLSLGIGPSTAIYCALDRLLLRALPYSDADRLVALHETQTGKGFRNVSLPNLMDWRAQTTGFDGMAGYMTRTFGMRVRTPGADTSPVVIRAALATSDLFHVLRGVPSLGRVFSEREETEGRRVIVLSEAVWAREFNRAPNVIGRTVQLNEEPFDVVGVLPDGFVFPDPAVQVDAYIPMNHVDYNNRDVRPLDAVALLRPDVGFAHAQSELRTIGARIAQAYPEDNVRGGADMERLDEAWKGSRRRPLLLLTVAAVLLLVIVATNVIHLLLSRALARRREMGIRLAIGAGMPAILRQALAEALLLSGAAAAIGLLLARWTLHSLPAVLRFAGASLPITGVTVDARSLVFTAALCLSSTVLCGFAPVLFLRSVSLNLTVKDGREPDARSGASRLRRPLVIGQVALSLVLLLCAGAFLRVFLNLMNRDPGFQSSQVYYFGIGLPDTRYTELQAVEFHHHLADKLRQIPGVEAVGVARVLPLNGRTNTTSFQFEGAGLPRSQWSWVAYNVVDPAYFAALRIPQIAGRSLSWEADRPGRPLAVVVNRAFQRIYQLDGSLLGRRVQLRFVTDMAPKNSLWEIVGVVGDTYQTGLDTNIRPQIYIPVGHAGLDGGSYVIRTTRADSSLPALVAGAVRAVDPNLERINLRRLDDWVSASLGDRRLPALLTGVLAALGLLLTTLGIYGTVALEIHNRRREIAIRVALGAPQTRITGFVLAKGLLLACVGSAIGILLFLPVRRVIEAQLYETAALDPIITVGVVSIVIASALIACLRPLRLAWRLDPLAVLRHI